MIPAVKEGPPNARKPRWHQLPFPAAWAQPAMQAPAPRTRRAVPLRVRRAFELPRQTFLPAIALWREEEETKRRKCSPFARARTVPLGRLAKIHGRDAKTLPMFDVGLDRLRPKTRGDCMTGPRPCPWLACRYHTAIDVHPETGAIKEIFPHLRIVEEPEGPGLEMLEAYHGTCALDICDREDGGNGGHDGLLELTAVAVSGRPIGNRNGLTIEETGAKLNLSIERARQIGAQAMQDVRVKLRWADAGKEGV